MTGPAVAINPAGYSRYRVITSGNGLTVPDDSFMSLIDYFK